jgi:hypothetical protein
MAWFLNHYTCANCNANWNDEWSCTCDDDCPHCGARHMSPYESEDLSEIIEKSDKQYVVLRSQSSAGHTPRYREIARFATKKGAEAFLGLELTFK